MTSVTNVIYEVTVGEFIHRYSLQGIGWRRMRDMVPLYTSIDTNVLVQGRDSVAGYLLSNISIRLDQPIVGRVLVFFGDEVITIEGVEVLDEGIPCNFLLADTVMTWIAREIKSPIPLKLDVKIHRG